MIVKIGPYTKDLIPLYNLERSYEMWRSDALWLDEDDYTWYDKIVFKSFDVLRKLLQPINSWSNNRQRKIKIKYHNYDTWGLDHTLALIILPGLKQLKATNHGFGLVENADVPEHLRATQEQLDAFHTDGTDCGGEERWNWIMDELIWTFTQIAEEYPEDFGSGNIDFQWEELDKNNSRLVTGPNHTYSIDFDAKKKYDDRIQNGLILFGKYYRNLWD